MMDKRPLSATPSQPLFPGRINYIQHIDLQYLSAAESYLFICASPNEQSYL